MGHSVPIYSPTDWNTLARSNASRVWQRSPNASHSSRSIRSKAVLYVARLPTEYGPMLSRDHNTGTRSSKLGSVRITAPSFQISPSNAYSTSGREAHRRTHSARIMPCRMTLAYHAGVIRKDSFWAAATMVIRLTTPSASREAYQYKRFECPTCSTARYRRRHSVVHSGSLTTSWTGSEIWGFGDC